MAQKFLTDIELTRGLKDSSGDLGTSGQVLSSTGSALNWVDNTASASVVYQDGFTGNGSTTAFTLANSIDNENKTQVYIDGVYQHKDTYSLSGTTLTFSTAPPNTSDIEVISFKTVTADGDILTDSEFSSAGLMTTNGSGVYSITTNNSSNWNTAYTYSQVGHLPLAGGTLTGNLIVGGDLTVNGTTTTLSTQTVEVEDNILQLNTTQGSPDTATATTSGISVYRGNGVTQASFIFDDGDDTWDLTNNLVVDGNATFAGDVAISSTMPKLTFTDLQQDDWRIMNDNGDFRFTNIDGSGHALTLAANNNATFTGDVRADNIGLGSDATSFGTGVPTLLFKGTNSTNGRSGALYFKENDGTDTAALYVTDGNDGYGTVLTAYQGSLKFATGSLTGTVLTLDQNNNATFAGDVTVGDDLNITGDQLTFTNDSASAYIRAADSLLIQSDWNTGENKPIYLQPSAVTELTIATGLSTFAGSVQLADTKNLQFIGSSGDHARIVYTQGNGTTGDNWGLTFYQNSGSAAGIDFFASSEAAGDGNIRFNIGGTPKMLINNSGNIGIGVTAPGHKLDVSGNIRLQGGDRKIVFNNGSVETSLDQMAGGVGGMGTLGRFGVATVSPNNILQVVGNITIGTGATNEAVRTMMTGGTMVFQSTDANHRIIIRGTQSTDGTITGNNNNMDFYEYGNYNFYSGVNTSTGARNLALTITSGGNIGIGTTSPDRSLDVQKALSIFGSGDGTEIMLRGQVEGTGTVRNVGSFHWSIRSDIGGDNDDLKLVRFITGSYVGIAMQVQNSTGDIFFGNTVVNPASGFSNQRGFGYDNSTGNLQIASTSGNALTVGRNESSDGAIIELRKESNVVGTLGSNTTSGQMLLDISGSSSNGNIRFVTNGGEVMRMTSAYNVVIGTTTSSNKLFVANGNIAINNNHSFMVGGDNDTAIGRLKNTSGVLNLEGDGTRSIRFGSGTNGEVVRIDNSNQRVGIGTSSPGTKLDIGGMADPTVRIKSDAGGDPQLRFDAAAANRSARIKFYDNGVRSHN